MGGRTNQPPGECRAERGREWAEISVDQEHLQVEGEGRDRDKGCS